MDAVIALHKPRLRVPAQAPMPRTQAPRETTRSITPEQLVTAGSRIVMIAPHPDDEILALGATLASLAHHGHEVLVVAVTDGEGSHPGSARWTPDQLRSTRQGESRMALQRLRVGHAMIRLGLPDGNVTSYEKQLAAMLPLGSSDTVFVPWRHDGHADHEACARAALAACRTVGAKCIEFPVWALVPSHPAAARLRRYCLQRIALPSSLLNDKREAVASFTSQLTADGATPPVLHDGALPAWQGPAEWVLA